MRLSPHTAPRWMALVMGTCVEGGMTMPQDRRRPRSLELAGVRASAQFQFDSIRFADDLDEPVEHRRSFVMACSSEFLADPFVVGRVRTCQQKFQLPNGLRVA